MTTNLLIAQHENAIKALRAATERNTKLHKVLLAAKGWLDTNYPTHGDGAWSLEFISEVFHGEHLGHDNRPTVLRALASIE